MTETDKERMLQKVADFFNCLLKTDVFLIWYKQDLMKCVWFSERNRDGFKATFHSRRSMPRWLKVPFCLTSFKSCVLFCLIVVAVVVESGWFFWSDAK